MLLAVAAAWLPGQLHASTTRWWLLGGVLPLVVAWRAPGSLTRWPVTLIALLAAWSAATALWAPAPGAALRVALLHLGWAAALAVGLAASTGDRRLLPRWVAAAALLAALPSLARPGGTFGNPTLLACFLAPTLVYGLASLPALPPRWRALVVLSTAVQALALISTGSLGAAAAVATGLALHVTLREPGSPWHPARLLALPAGALVLVLPGVGDHLAGRWQLTRIVAAVATDALPFGVGAGQLHGTFLERQSTAIAAGDADPALWSNLVHAHNEPLQALVELGLPGLVLLVPLVAALVGPRSPARAALAAALTVALVSPALHEPATAALAFVCAGVCLGERAGRDGPPPTRGLTSPVARWRLLLLAPAALATGHLLGDRLTVAASPEALRLAAALSLTPEPALRAHADGLLPAHPTRARLLAEHAVHRTRTPAGLLLLARAHLAALEPHRAVAACEEAARLHPRLFAAWVDLALARAEAGDPHGARAAADRARQLRPDDPRLRWLPR